MHNLQELKIDATKSQKHKIYIPNILVGFSVLVAKNRVSFNYKK